MNTQSSLWLYPLVLMSLFSLAVYARMGIYWTWGFCLQSLAMLAAGLAGFIFPWASIACALVGWGIFVGSIIVPRSILTRLEKNLMLLNPDAAVADARALKFFFWGAPGRFWLDVAGSMAAFIRGDAEEAEGLIASWRERRIPRSTRDGLNNYLLTGKVIMRDWNGIIMEFQRIRDQSGGRAPYGVALSAARAYLELGLVAEALACLEMANLRSVRLTNEAIYMVFLPFFSLAGAADELAGLLSQIGVSGLPLPRCASLYWSGRCLAAQGKVGEARAVFQQALSLTPAKNTAWPERIEYQLARLDGKEDLMAAPDWSYEIARASEILRRASLVSEIVAPRKPSKAALALVLALSLSYLVTHSFSILASTGTLAVSLLSFKWGVLDADLVKQGEIWRLVSYMFLHTHISHLALNLIGLWWFGRLTENFYGTGRFAFIFFACGILSGLAQTALSADKLAVGASGAVMGLFGAAAAGIFRSKGILPKNVRLSELSWMLGLAVAQVLLDQIVPRVAVFAHLGGLVSGLALGLVLPMRAFETGEARPA